ncbi:TPA: carbohydrate binding domain-containing protein [Klebsiella pneumoniae subsp. pneumoniae]|nr:carbohydrate binding domain-containing protein [Klebsiella pneumoniae subsp. pneumoniae]HDS2403118.1 carbohydrate binding domain-containing protein [Klebsiella pneumoniae subsp. pneumoniae]HDS2414140.1 carbohydrate binding domain-containing protein [Klebsiella pneumoniae subsp. pneumoniae]HDS2418389.1 carbohydrate binding domain-containing protein [Klebsiella pneumoniae subsp. ozaenae]HDU5353368.1 carbohydrate binding domain-containing protein [Klebsiella pneumoniae subsp. ozaenae]
MANNIIKGRKGGSSKQRTPTEQPDDLQSVAKAKILIALGEGEFAGGLTGKDIYLDGTPLENADGSQNFSGVAWEFRPGTQAQSYIQGIPGTENEISVGTEVSSQTAWTHTFTNTQLSAVRVRLKWPSLMKQEDDGDVVGNTVKYAIDLQTDGGAWQTVLETAVSGKTTSGYERSHRIDLPQAGSTWTLRLRKVSPDANSVKIGDVMTLQSYTEVIDAKLRYPHTALLYIEFDSSQFNGSIPQISCEPRGRVIRVPDNYNPETREYTGTWTGGFKWAWTDNPAWIYYDIVVSDRFGLGDRLTSANISKWALYPIAQYCDQLVPDGRGGDGMEPRYICNVYVQERNDAYTVLRDFAAIFRGMTCWSGEQIIVQADMPRDVDFNYTRANILGSPRYSSSTSKARYTNALVSWSDPDNAYADAMEPAFIPELVSRYSFNQLEVTAIGCTRQSEAHRKGLWGILTNNKDRMVEIDVGLDGRIPQPGYIIGLGDERLAGRVNGGRISAVNGRVITLDRDIDAKEGDRLHLNLPSGISQARTIQSVNGRRQVTVTTAYSETPEAECVWIVEYTDLVPQQYRVIGVKDNNNGTLTITGVAHDPDKFPRIDIGAIIDQRPVSVLPAGNQSPPDDIVITSRSVVNQGISVETMQVNWSAVSGAIAYEAQWRRNDGNWINVPRSSTTSFEVSGIYAGRYLVRVRAINAAEISSGWAYSEEKTLTGKVGEPLAPLALATRSLVHGVQVSWEFPTGSGDTLRTELQYSKNQDGSAPMPLSDVAYPGKSYQQMGLSMGAEFWYRARLVDRLGNESPWTGWVQGMASDNFDDYYENLTDAIKDTAAWEETQRTISETQEGIRNTQQELEQTAEALRKEAEDQAKQVSQDIDASAKSITADVDGKISAVNKTITDEITSVNEALDSGLAQANKGVQEAKSAVADANKQIATVNKSLTDSITQVRQSVTDTAAEINATIDLEIARVSKTLADGDAALNAQIKTAENGLKQSLSQVNTSLTNAVKQETADRIADVNAKASQAADELLAATQGIEASIESLTQVMKSADENLAREMSSLAAGANIQFDSQVIWYFNNQTTEGWTGSAGVPGVSQDGWLRPADSATDPYITSPGGLAVDGAAYRFIMLRFRKTGKPVWAGEIRWVSAGENFNNTKRYIVAEPEYADGVATLTVRDIPWTGNIDRIRLDLTNQQDASNFIEFDWIAVGRPAPGASTAALQDVRSTLSNALTAEAQARSTLAAQMRGSYDGSDLEKVTSGLLYQEKTARVTAISAEVKARESLQTQFNDNKAAVSGELSSLTTEQSAQASRIGGLETSLGKKADAAALTSLTQKVEQQGATLTSQGAALTSLTNRVGQTETGLAGTNEALSGLQSVVTQHGDRITSQGQSITKLTSDLGMTNAALAKKAEAAAVTALTQQVEQNGRDIRSNTDSITSLSNQLVNGQPNRWSRRLYPVQLANAGTVPSFSDVRAVAPTVVDEVADAAKLDFTSAGSYLIALYSCQVKVAADTTITLAPGARVFDDTGAIFVNGVQVARGNASWNTVSFELKAGWNTVEFLVNQWTGQAYINLGLKLSDKVAEMYSGLGVSALANAAGVLSSNVSQIGNEVVSNSQSITQLRNALTQTDANVASKADQTAMNSLTGRVEKTESGLTAANANITSLKSAVRAGNASGGDLIPNPTFDPAYDQMGFSVVSTTAEEVPPGCPYGYAARIASRDHHPNFAAFPATLNDVIEISALVACGAGTANFNLYVGTAVRPDTSTGAPLMAGGGKSPSATWQRTTWRFKVTQAMVDRGYIRPFLQISQNSPYGTVWFVTDWHMRNVTAAQKVQDTADATAAAVDSLTTTVTQQGNLLTSTGNRTTQLENGLATTNAAVAKKADATAVQDLTNTVTQLGNDLTAANSAITKLTGNLANTDKALAQKADATALATLDTKVTQQGKTLESQSNSLTNLSNSLSQVAADIDASGQIPGNLVVNPSFERGLDGYTGRSTATSVVEVSAPHSGTRALKVDPGSVSPGQYIPFVQGRTYEIGVWVKEPGATTDNGAGNNKLRIGNSAGQPVFERPYNSGTVGTNWTLVSGRWKATETASLPVTLSNYLISGSRYFDDFYVTDVTDRVDIDATAGAVTGLTSRVSTAEGAITSQSQQLTNLQNSLNTTNSNVSKKADATALTSVDNRVTETEGKLTTQSQQLTNLANVLTATRNAGDNLIPNFDFLQGSTAWDIQYPAGVTFGDFGDGKAGVRLNRTTTISPGIFSNNNKPVPLNGQRKYRVVVKAKGVSGAMSLLIRRQNKIGQTDSTYEDKTVTLTTDWQTITWETGLTAAGADGQNFNLYSHPTNGEIWLDSVRVFDITDETNIKATSDAVSSLTGTVTNQGNTLTSQGQSITALNNALEGVKGDVAKKADASAVSSLTNRVTQTEKDIRSQADSLTSLNTSLKQQATRGANVLPDGSFESYAVGDVLSNARAVITSEAAHSGTKSLRVTRSTEYNPNATDNNDTHIFSGMQVRDNAVYYVEAWVKLPAGSTADPTVYMVLGFSFQDSANGWSWPGLNVKVSELSVDNWTKVSGYLTNNRTALKQAMVRISIPNTPKVRLGDAFLIDDLIITDVTDAKAALDAADANAQALSSLSASVTQNGKNITSQGSAITKLQSDVTQLGKDISGKADASALTNLTTRVTATEGSLKSQGDSLTSLQNSLNTTNSNVAKKADATALQSLQNTVEQHGRDLTAQSSALTNLENNFSSLAVGGTNLIRNADTLEGWSSRHATETYLGDRVAYTRLAKGASGYIQLDEQTLDVTGRTEFVFSFYAKGAYDGQEMASYFYNPSNTTTTETSQGVKGGAGDGKAVTKLTTAWARYWVKWVIPATSGTKRLIAARLESATSADKEVWLCRPQLETGTVMTDWSPSPDDAASGITANTSAINSLTSRVTNAEGQLTAQSQSITNLQNSLNTTNNNVAQKASAQSVSDLTSRVTSAEGKITSQGQAITKLQGDLSSTTDKVNTKADQTALNALTGRVEKTEAGLTAANSNIVSLTAAVNAGNAAGDDYIPNPSFDPAYDRMGYDVVETTADGVPADCPFRYAVRLAGRDHVPKINNIAVTPGDVYEMSALVACGTGSADFNFYIGRATTATGGIGARASGGNTRTTTAWKRATWRFTVPADTNFLRPFLQVNQSSPFGTVWYAADWHMRNVTAANSAQKTADATAKAVDSLTTTVSQQGDTLSSIGTRTTSLENSLRSTNDTVSKKADTTAVTQLQGTVTQQGNDIAAANSALTKLSSDLATTNANVNKKADASAMNTLQNQVTEQGKTLSAQGDSLTQLSNSLSQTAADIDASGKMPGNLIVNGSFERGAAGFTGWSSTATVADLQVPHSGNKALKMSAGQSNLVGQEISITQGRTYRMGVWAKQDPGTTIKDADNTKFRVADSTGLLAGSNYGPFSSGWQLVTFDWKATKTTMASFQLTTFLSAGAMYFDDFHVLDVTDEKDIAANAGAISQMNTRVTAAEGAITTQAQQLTKLSGDLAVTNAAVSKKAEQSAVTGLTTRMTSAEGKLDSQSQQLTSLQNSLTTMNTELGKKADTSAVSSLTGRVSQVENTITSQSQSITSLTSTINTIRTQGANPWVDGTFESYSDGQVLGGSGTAVVVASQKFTGDKSLKLRRDENNGGNSDKQLGTWQSVREDAKFRFEFWAMMPADQAPSSGWTTLVGIQSQNAAGQNAWQAAVTISEASLGARDKWVKFTGIASNNGAGRTRAVVWISTRGATGNGTPGYSLYIDDLVITDVTDAKAAQDASDATASAVSGLTARVTDAEGKITAQAQQQTALASKVDNANSRVDNMAKTLSDSQSTQASLNTSLQSQIDAQAAANIKNQTTLDNTIKSVASITSTQQTHATALEALATQQTTLTSSVGDLSASVQNTAKTVADVNGTVSSLWSMKVETVNGKNVGAGITLGSNGETSDMILYADRFSLFNRNNATAVPVMVAEGNELYIDTARIKNSSLTSTKIADGSITNAKIGNEIRSNDFVDGSRGWRIAKDGSSQFNNVIVRGAVYATDGIFKGTVQADRFIGDIATSASFNGFTVKGGEGSGTMNAWYQNSGYPMTITLNCTVRCNSYSGGVGDQSRDFYVVLTFNINGVQSTRRVVVDMRDKAHGLVDIPQSFTVNIPASNSRIGISLTGASYGPQQSEVSVSNIVVTAFRSNNGSFGQ